VRGCLNFYFLLYKFLKKKQFINIVFLSIFPIENDFLIIFLHFNFGKNIFYFNFSFFRIPLRMPASAAAQIAALRPCLEALVVRACQSPAAVLAHDTVSPADTELGALVRTLSSPQDWQPTGEEGWDFILKEGKIREK
jgi:hypothetical protein